MRTSALRATALAALLLFGAGAVAAQTADPEEHDAHHPAEAPAASEAGTAAGMEGMSGMKGMMTPEMMKMMQGMMGGPKGEGGMNMESAMMMCPSMQMMMGMRAGADMQGMMGGPGLLYGMPHGATEEMTPESVRTFLEKRLEWHANPRLKIGKIAKAADGGITAEIVTVDGSLVQKLAFNRHPGLVRQIE
ncbi:MAG: hypothetical protein Q8J92_04525 [Parvibaculum sp.]|nr:hypothetical protein [Parvibaculum sp.]